MEKIIEKLTSPLTSLSQKPPVLQHDVATDTMISDRSRKMKNHVAGLEALPSEIIGHILTFLPPLTLVDLSQTSQHLRSHAHNDLLWFNFIRENVPSTCDLDSPLPARSWRQLYIAHHPYWFLARHKLWFGDVLNTGKIILARYNPRRGCIEAFQLVAEHGAHTFENWKYDNDVIIHTFNPRVRLFTDDPVINLEVQEPHRDKRLQKETAMQTGSTRGICSMISFCQPIPKHLQARSMALWPPRNVPSDHRVRNESPNKFQTAEHRPSTLSQMSDQTFRIRKWLEFSNLMQQLTGIRMGEEVMTFSTLPQDSYTPTRDKPYQGIWVGDYSGHGCEFLLVLQRKVTPNIIMTRELSTGILPEGVSMKRVEAETLEEEKDASDWEDVKDEPECSCDGCSASSESHVNEDSGRLEAIKLTGDINVPRGQYTWIAEDIGNEGLIRIGDEQMFKGARMVKSWGRIAGAGFKHDRFIPSQLILISHDTLAQYWEVS